ncbi:TIGR00282 family metallophosphoesterase [Mycoplasmopsis cynos]|uniref:Metallophosphoesterase YmdB n=1 Tax=Mycoplasmopsis cynos TaxID=171284 RepID=A0A449AHB5_9BACT|nr:TIGR00282 family metallophosphoesterase [Mycoplasmopsis cynos]MCU9935106.1 YmdB family metallophosphoesterase [Mycoplasmopsis cynos]TQC54896.1 YmdB family metallophosphoesterase [Mycoplasmopsis cynos]WAM08560.1 YmdB family metallophosphoesterase [Mycoplasmopsis cynos]WQQ15208.1 TIGR00282 family metallophosphoesterase [Mycoplasmopsis cynos]WQQ17012.1 TIGR00282 family metallophosphoesterase [Mycoplasmopsis cynos]
MSNTSDFIKILFIGDIFGLPGIVTIEKYLKGIVKEHNIDYVIAQGENVTGRKGLNETDYIRLKKAGINFFTMGNHVWANSDIEKIINNPDIVRPYNIENGYPGEGTRIVNIKNFTLRITSMMGITFNELRYPWEQNVANSFISAADILVNNTKKTDFSLIDFHGETTSEKYVFGLHVDGHVDAVVGTHTHVQTNDDHILENGTCYITDVGMTGPIDSAIGARVKEVKSKITNPRSKEKFYISSNNTQLNAVKITLYKDGIKNKKNTIEKINFFNLKIY